MFIQGTLWLVMKDREGYILFSTIYSYLWLWTSHCFHSGTLMNTIVINILAQRVWCSCRIFFFFGYLFRAELLVGYHISVDSAFIEMISFPKKWNQLLPYQFNNPCYFHKWWCRTGPCLSLNLYFLMSCNMENFLISILVFSHTSFVQPVIWSIGVFEELVVLLDFLKESFGYMLCMLPLMVCLFHSLICI